MVLPIAFVVGDDLQIDIVGTLRFVGETHMQPGVTLYGIEANTRGRGDLVGRTFDLELPSYFKIGDYIQDYSGTVDDVSYFGPTLPNCAFFVYEHEISFPTEEDGFLCVHCGLSSSEHCAGGFCRLCCRTRGNQVCEVHGLNDTHEKIPRTRARAPDPATEAVDPLR